MRLCFNLRPCKDMQRGPTKAIGVVDVGTMLNQASIHLVHIDQAVEDQFLDLDQIIALSCLDQVRGVQFDG